jgi:hypothetical protein
VPTYIVGEKNLRVEFLNKVFISVLVIWVVIGVSLVTLYPIAENIQDLKTVTDSGNSQSDIDSGNSQTNNDSENSQSGTGSGNLLTGVGSGNSQSGTGSNSQTGTDSGNS